MSGVLARIQQRFGRQAGPSDLGAALLAPVVLLSAIGAVEVFSATGPLAMNHTLPPYFVRQALALVVGGVLAFAASRIPLRTWHALALPFWGVSVLALAATLVEGHVAGGARRWLALPGIGAALQPAEFAKIATLLALAALLSRREVGGRVSPSRTALAFGLAALPAGLCLLQPDFGNAVLLLTLSGLIVYVAGAPLRLLVLPALAGAAGIALYSLVEPYALRRWLGFLDPWARARNEGFQLVQSFVAFGRGGLFGVGIGDGRQKLFYLPEAHTDFILSVVGEELGLAGVLVVLGGFVALAVAGLRIALRARQRFGMLLAFGMTMLLTLPAALNAAVVMGLLPTKGLTLPFLSYGRSSLLVCFAAVGILLGLARGVRDGPRERAAEERA